MADNNLHANPHQPRMVPVVDDPIVDHQPGHDFPEHQPQAPAGHLPNAGGNVPPPDAGGNVPPPNAGGNIPPPNAGGNVPPPGGNGAGNHQPGGQRRMVPFRIVYLPHPLEQQSFLFGDPPVNVTINSSGVVPEMFMRYLGDDIVPHTREVPHLINLIYALRRTGRRDCIQMALYVLAHFHPKHLKEETEFTLIEDTEKMRTHAYKRIAQSLVANETTNNHKEILLIIEVVSESLRSAPANTDSKGKRYVAKPATMVGSRKSIPNCCSKLVGDLAAVGFSEDTIPRACENNAFQRVFVAEVILAEVLYGDIGTEAEISRMVEIAVGAVDSRKLRDSTTALVNMQRRLKSSIKTLLMYTKLKPVSQYTNEQRDEIIDTWSSMHRDIIIDNLFLLYPLSVQLKESFKKISSTSNITHESIFTTWMKNCPIMSAYFDQTSTPKPSHGPRIYPNQEAREADPVHRRPSSDPAASPKKDGVNCGQRDAEGIRSVEGSSKRLPQPLQE